MRHVSKFSVVVFEVKQNQVNYKLQRKAGDRTEENCMVNNMQLTFLPVCQKPSVCIL